MTETNRELIERPRDLYALLALIASYVSVPMRAAARPAVDAWRLLCHQRSDVETAIALRAMSGTGSAWWAMGRGLGVVALLSALVLLLSRGFMYSGGYDGSGFIQALQGPYGFLVSLIAGVLSQLSQPHLWFGILIAFMLRRYFASETWRSEIKVLPIPASTIVSRILALLFLVAVGWHLIGYVVNNAYWLILVFITDRGGAYDQFWPWGLLVGPMYYDRRRAGLLEILINEPTGHLLGVAMSFLRLAIVIALALYLRNTIKAVGIYALAAWLFWRVTYSLAMPIQGAIHWLTSKFLSDYPGFMMGNVLMFLIGLVLCLITLGIVCRMLQRYILRLMEE